MVTRWWYLFYIEWCNSFVSVILFCYFGGLLLFRRPNIEVSHMLLKAKWDYLHEWNDNLKVTLTIADWNVPIFCRLLQEWNHLSVPCLWEWMKAGIRSSLILLIWQEEHMEPIMWRLWEFRFMPIAVWEESISLTAYIRRKNSHQNSSCIFQCR